MRVFVSWSGVRSQAIATALRDWLPGVIDGIDLFHSEDIPKGSNWHAKVVEALRNCRVGIFCITPEALRSRWLHFEAGALAQHGSNPALFTYLYGVREIEGPLSHFQATRFDRADSSKFINALAKTMGVQDLEAVNKRFEDTWPSFEAAVDAGTLVPIQQLVPEFESLFDDEKTFNESFPDCSDKRWADRLRRTTRTHDYLSQQAVDEVVSTNPYLRGAFAELLIALDRYDMHIGAYLLKTVEFGDLRKDEQNRLEETRKRILDVVASLQRENAPPLFRESLAFESERASDKRKAQIHELEGRLHSGALSMKPVSTSIGSLNWSLDRIIYYLAIGAGHVPGVSFDDLVKALRTEEERARTRDLVDGLQPLYYAAEAIDETLPPGLPQVTVQRLLEISGDMERFLSGHGGRDSGGQIRRRLESIRTKLAQQALAQG
jgi:hypothetical protein